MDFFSIKIIIENVAITSNSTAHDEPITTGMKDAEFNCRVDAELDCRIDAELDCRVTVASDVDAMIIYMDIV